MYFSKFQTITPHLIETLKILGVHEKYLKFGGEGELPSKKPSIPTDARSEFLANRAMGDWAENILANSISGFQVIHYGDADSLAAGDLGFKETYLSKLEDTRLYGKRPDLLIMKKNFQNQFEVLNKSTLELKPLVEEAEFSIEVRSSKFEALKYMSVRRQEKLDGKKTGQDTPSFTVKIEDLKIVYRWLEQHDCPQVYCQVFFDSVFVINFLDIFSIISRGKNKGKEKEFSIETPEKSQQKATIMIPITSGTQIGDLIELPKLTVEPRITRLGRHDSYIKPIGGKLNLCTEKLRQVALNY